MKLFGYVFFIIIMFFLGWNGANLNWDALILMDDASTLCSRWNEWCPIFGWCPIKGIDSLLHWNRCRALSPPQLNGSNWRLVNTLNMTLLRLCYKDRSKIFCTISPHGNWRSIETLFIQMAPNLNDIEWLFPRIIHRPIVETLLLLSSLLINMNK